MFRIASLLMAVICNLQVESQDVTTITIKSGEDIGHLYREIYKYAGFVPGAAYFQNGSVAKTKFNFDYVEEKVLFINSQNDTLYLTDNNAIEKVVMASDTFCYDNGNCVQLLADAGVVKLALRQKVWYNEQSIGAFGIPSSTHAIENRNTLMDFQNHKLQLNRDIVLTRQKHYLFSAGDGHFMPVSKRNLSKTFSKHSEALDRYFTQKKIDLSDENQLKELFAFLSTLQ